ncbi:MAG: hypothetical protein MPI95_04955 [Nitrosopumilus sp.]|nr:hypothetical protein [Nitrosopumilus sp.]MDA7958423.1 hypothetical protein [Nitrosopumilus sp.]
MLLATSVSGNVRGAGDPEGADVLRIPRSDMEKGRLRRRTEGGRDVGISVEPGTLRDGDVLGCDPPVVVRQEPERVVRVRSDDPVLMAVAGHAIGNWHRPISTGGGAVTFPARSDSDADAIRGLLGGTGAEVSIEEAVFTPRGGSDVHGH